MASISDLLDGKKVCICAGSGGVGKTTTSAAIAAGMAARGKKVAVLTIDPAKRLADSLGLPELGNTERQVDPKYFRDAGADPGEGELWAMMLDSKATFDEVIRKHAPDEQTRDAILGNRIYQQLSAALAGSQEYMAMEKLFEIWSEDRYDLLVLDTPPAQNALDFLEAPNRLLQFIDGRALQVFLSPGGLAGKVFGRGASMMFSILRRITGVDLIRDLGEFFQAFSGMAAGFRERAHRVGELLGDEQTTFLVVCGPQGEPIAEAVYFHRRLVQTRMPFGGVIVNRVRHGAGAGAVSADDLTGLLGGDRDLAARTLQSHGDNLALAARDRRNVDHLVNEMRTRAVIEVPYLDFDVHDLKGLLEVDRYLFAADGTERARMAAEA